MNYDKITKGLLHRGTYRVIERVPMNYITYDLPKNVLMDYNKAIEKLRTDTSGLLQTATNVLRAPMSANDLRQKYQWITQEI